MKVILSRKGFDSGAGRHPSPYFVKEGRLLSLPIPENNKIYSTDTERFYSDLQFDDNTTYLDIMNQLGLKGFIDENAHLDPDINQKVLKDRKPGWRGLFGQCDAAQKHLSNNEVQPDDLFLFFGWFRNVEEFNGKHEYVTGTNKHIIWGYMQVGEIDSINKTTEYESWKLDHPHYCNRDRKFNTGYIARENLSFFPELPGYGVFSYNKSLVLTDPDQKNRSVWRLPLFFHPSYRTKMTYRENHKLWKLHNSYCILNSVGRGQEFVITGNDHVIAWTKNLIINSNKSQSELHQTETNLFLIKPEPELYAQRKEVVNNKKQPALNNSDGFSITFCEDYNLFNVEENNIVTMICYRNSTNERFKVWLNLEDMENVKKFGKWKVEKSRYKVYANIGIKNTYLHRLIFGDCEGKKVLVKNGNYFDCRRENLYVKP